MKIDYIKGAKGGGGGGGSAPTQTPDNLRSKDTVEVILALCEGPIEGLVNGSKSFYVGETQLQADSGDYNFQAFTLNFFPGVENADPIVPVLGGQSSNQAVNVTLFSGTAVTRTTIQSNLDSLDIRLAFSRLMTSSTSGTFTADAVYKIEYKQHSLVDWTILTGDNITINGKTTSTYIKEHRIPLVRVNDTWDIRVTKISEEDTTEFLCTVGWESFQETIQTPKAYDNTAIVQLVGQASDQFSSIPQWSGIYNCLVIKVPTNYDPLTRLYDGVWDGSWKLAWTNNPAWCFYDFVMNERYGIKSYYNTIDIDKYDVYDAAQWCDQLVPDGNGGMQPRYTYNDFISEARSGKELARYIAGVFNATYFDDLNGKSYLRVDKDDTASFIFAKENIMADGFEYGYTDITGRYNDITVSFVNPQLNWEQDRRRVFNQALIDKNGRIPLDFIAVGCTNEHEALRRAQYKLITSNTENCIVTFTTNRLGQMVNPFDVILICDPDMGYGISGRLKTIAEDANSATLRTPIYLEAGVTYTIRLQIGDGSTFSTTLLDTEPGYTTNLTFADTLPDITPDRATFSLEAAGLIGLPRPFRVTKAEEQDGNPDAYVVQGMSIDRNKWFESDNIVDNGVINYSSLPNPMDPPGPTSVGFLERFIPDLKQFQIVVSPNFNRGAYKYYANDHAFEVYSRLSNTNDLFIKRELLYQDTLVNHPPGLYDFKILGKSYLGPLTRLETSPIYQFNVTNPKDAPKDIDWLKINVREVYWGYENPPQDFAGFILRYHNQVGLTTWDDAAQPHQGLLSVTSFYTSLIPPSARVIMVRAVDVFGIVSENSAIIFRDLGDVTAVNVAEQFDLGPTWAGTKTGCSIDGSDLVADDTGTLMYTGVPTAKVYHGSGGLYDATYLEMIYFDSFTSTANGNLIFDVDFEGAGYEVSIRNTGDTIWQPVPDRLLTPAGSYDLKIRVFGGPIRGVIHQFSVIIEAEDTTEYINDITVPATPYRLTLTKPYNTIKIVAVTIQDDGGAATAVAYRVLDKSVTPGANNGPQIELYDSSGTVVGGLIDATIIGWNS